MAKSLYVIVSLASNCALVVYFLLYYSKSVPNTSNSLMKNVPQPKNTARLEFIPKHPVISCNDLFTDSPANTFKMSTRFDLLYQEFDSEVNSSVGGKKGPVAGFYEGHSQLLPEQYKALHYMAGLKFVRTICETGFNYGHSSFNFLTASDKAVVHSFDIGSHPYTKQMANYLSAKFPGRFFIRYGDSTASVPEFVQKNSDIRCDLIFVDGCHSYPVAKSDLETLMKIASNDNIIVMDDFPTTSYQGVQYGKAWEELVAKGSIEEIMRCKFREIVSKHASEAAFVIGRAVNI